MGVYDTPSQKCPYCSNDCEADWVDVGVGMVQCGPYHCEVCHASEIGPEKRKWFKLEKVDGEYKTIWLEGAPFNDNEKKYGWYDPEKGGKISPYANTVGGKLVDHITAKEAYNIGLLDEKEIDNE